MITHDNGHVKPDVSISDTFYEKYPIQINRKIVARSKIPNKTVKEFLDVLVGSFNKVENWETVNLSVSELGEAIAHGFTVRSGIKKGGNEKENVVNAHWLMLDFDKTSLDATLKNPITQYACLTYFTASYLPGVNEKHRLVFLLNRPVNPSEYEFLYSKIREMYPESDSTGDAGRLFYGSPDKSYVKILNEDRVLTVEPFMYGYDQNLVTKISDEPSETKTVDEYFSKADTDEDPVTIAVYKYFHDEIFVGKLDSDIRRLYCLYDHKWNRRSPDKKGIISKFDGRNPYSSTNTTGTSFVVSYMGDSLPFFFSRGGETTDKGFIEYWWKIKGHGYTGDLTDNFKKVVHDICEHFQVKKFDFRTTKGADKEKKGRQKRQGLLEILAKTREILGGRLKFNEMSLDQELDGESIDMDTLQLDFAELTGIDTAMSIATQVIIKIANENSYHPVQEFYETLVYDGYSLDDISQKLLGTTDPICDVMLKKTLIAAVARVYQPGCKVDTICVLQGKQGQSKTDFWFELAYCKWHTDNITLGGGFGSGEKDGLIAMSQNQILELGELDGIIRKKDISESKRFVTSRNDMIRLPYSRKMKKVERRSIFVGTVNTPEFLNDETGNRRYWVIDLGDHDIDIKYLRKHRDSIWASAIYLYKEHVKFVADGGDRNDSPNKWWLEKYEDDINDERNKDFMTQDDLKHLVLPIAEKFTHVKTTNIIHMIDRSKTLDRSIQMRIAKILAINGWKKSRLTISGIKDDYWVNPSPTPTTRPYTDMLNEQAQGF